MRRVKDAVFDIIYTVLWIRPWAAVAIFLIGLLCFWVCFMQHSLAEEFCSIEENESVAVAEGTVTDWDYHRGGSKSGTERFRVTLDDGIECFMINDVLDLCKQRGLTERIENGDLAEIHSFDSDGDYYPRIFAISVNGESFLTSEEGIAIYYEEGRMILDILPAVFILGCACVVYPTIIFFIRKFVLK